MSEAWAHFAIIAFIQLALFVTCAYYQDRLTKTLRMFGWGPLIGIVFGLPLDLIVGKYFGLYTYILGFTPTFLILNWVVLNGLFAANILLAQHLRLSYFFAWTLVLMVAHEVPNYFFRVWTWQFSFSSIEHVIVLITGYFIGAAVGAMVWHVSFGYRFAFINNLFRSKP